MTSLKVKSQQHGEKSDLHAGIYTVCADDDYPEVVYTHTVSKDEASDLNTMMGEVLRLFPTVDREQLIKLAERKSPALRRDKVGPWFDKYLAGAEKRGWVTKIDPSAYDYPLWKNNYTCR